MGLGILKRYEANISDLDAIFETSLILKDAYETSLKSILKKGDLNHTQKQRLQNSIASLELIEQESIQSAESGAWARLYPQAFISVVSISEQILKDIFEVLVDIDLEKISVLDNKTISLKEIREKSFNLNHADWVEVVLKLIYGDNNPSEKINLQNIMSIKGIFKSYFNVVIDITEELQRSLHFYYQCRHLLIHNAGLVDDRFIKNMETVQWKDKYEIGTMVKISQKEYEECKKSFFDFFRILESAIEKH